SAWPPPRSWWTPKLLDAEAMENQLASLKGEHDFSTCSSGLQPGSSPVCHLLYTAIHREGDVITVDLVADRFLYRMVRRIVGELLRVGQAAANGTDFAGALDSRLPSGLQSNFPQAGARLAHPGGLTLMGVSYPTSLQPFPCDPLVVELQQLISLESP